MNQKNYAILIKNLSKEYINFDDKNIINKKKNDLNSKPKKALNNLNLKITAGKVFGLLGSNGAGKSSLINIIAGTVKKDSGEIFIDGDNNIDEVPKYCKSLIGVVPQEIVLDTFFPLYKNLEFTSGYYGKINNKSKIEEILRRLNLWEKRNNTPRELSGGMRRRFLIAKAMVHSPKILILDEPTAGVDIELRNNLWEYIRELNQKHGVTIIITTHYLMEAQELCDEIAFIDNGEIIKQDSKNNLLKQFSSKQVEIICNYDLDKGADVFNILTKQFNFKISVDKIDQNNFKIKFTTNNIEEYLLELLNLLKTHDIKIMDINISALNLEDVFKKILKDK